MGAALSQIWPSAPAFTEKDVPHQQGKVFIVTGASAGVGKALAQILFSLNAKVYLASRTETRVTTAISEIKAAFPNSQGSLQFLQIDLEDLQSVKRAADAFLKKENRLDALWNNAGVMLPPDGSETKQGYELQLGTNTLAPYLFTRLLTPLMIETAKGEAPGTVRVMWVASSAAELFSPSPGGVDITNLKYSRNVSSREKYGISKAGLVLLSFEYARRYKNAGIISVAMNPGNLKTDLRRHLSWPVAMVFGWISHDPIKGAHTELYSAFSSEINMENSGCWVIPWGRIAPIRRDIQDASVPESEDGISLSAKFWDWCEAELTQYL